MDEVPKPHSTGEGARLEMATLRARRGHARVEVGETDALPGSLLAHCTWLCPSNTVSGFTSWPQCFLTFQMHSLHL